MRLEQIKTNEAAKIKKLMKRVKNLKGKNKKRTHRLNRLYKGRLNDEDLFGVNDIDGDEVIVDVTPGENVEQDATVAEKEAKDKRKGIMVEPAKPLKRKDQIAFDEEVARKLDAQMKAKMEDD
uniref:Uncharacterized protein n=1 Tax=Tanacetum cinerariifolium TaxID=118510 RepID=A0A6L2JYJ7_TANCI|nr:hypothetical protein [Tanacetum cinerariifolium]